MLHADSVFLGEVEGRLAKVFQDFEKGELQKIYNFLTNPPDLQLVGPAKRDILKKALAIFSRQK